MISLALQSVLKYSGHTQSARGKLKQENLKGITAFWMERAQHLF